MSPERLENKCLFNTTDMNLWNQCDAVNLKTNFRVGDTVWNKTLQRIRFGEQTPEDLELLKSRYTSNFARKFDNAIHAFVTNMEVFAHNRKMLNNMNGELVTIQADFPNRSKPSSSMTKHGTIGNTGIPKILELKKGANVQLLKNINIVDGLVNGVTGEILDFAYRTIDGKKKIQAVIVKFDDPEIGKETRKEHENFHRKVTNENGVPIFFQQITHQAERKKGGKKAGKNLYFKQIPLALAFASTAHKLQGRTIKNQEIVVHGHNKIDYGAGYVMLSRCKNIEQVFLDKSFLPEKHLKVHEPSLEEAKKIDNRCIAAKLKEQKFDLFYVNMRSKNNITDIQHDPFVEQSSVVCLAQTCLKTGESFEWRKDRHSSYASSGDGKGVYCVTNNNLQETEFGPKITTDEFQIVNFKMKGKYQIFILYISPKVNSQVFQDISMTLDEMIVPGLEPVIIGDFNFDSKITNPLSKYLKTQLGLKQIINEPTFALGKNIIDHVYIRPAIEENISVKYRFNYYTDHCSYNISLN